MKVAIVSDSPSSGAASAYELRSDDFRVDIDAKGGHVLGIFDGRSTSHTNWISAPSNAPWQPLGSRWGLGFVDAGATSLHRHYWNNPELKCLGSRCVAEYAAGPVKLTVDRSLDAEHSTFTERYTFKNIQDTSLDLAGSGCTSIGIFAPFNDHYTSTTDSLAQRSHAHIWANGGNSSWVKTDQMGGHGRNLGIVLTKGALVGYSIESRDTILSSNTRGVFVLHPEIPVLAPGQESTVEWTLFWHSDWEDFYERCLSLSDQFVKIESDKFTIVPGESTTLRITGRMINSESTINGHNMIGHDEGSYVFEYSSDIIGPKTLEIVARSGGRELRSVVYLNVVPVVKDLLAKRVAFVTTKQQVPCGQRLAGAYVLYDNQMDGQVLYDTENDRNAGRERVGMGIFIARWLRNNKDSAVEESLKDYYRFVCTELHDEEGNVYNGPGDRTERLYNWPWVLQLHLAVAALNLDFSGHIAKKSPLDRFVMTLESFYAKGGKWLYAIGLPILEGLHALKTSGDEKAYVRALKLFTEHGHLIAEKGIHYPPFEVNFEQSIVAPAAITLLELYRWTRQSQWLEAARVQMKTLLRFAGKQPDYRVHDIAIRHWDGYWFGKDRMWGDTFPHYWSTLNAIALHHFGKASGEPSYIKQAQGILHSNLALFDSDGRGYCAWIYPLSVNGRVGAYRDPWANDQDFALSHLLQLEQGEEWCVEHD
ncbi:hypothetical protein jhhlp_008808 [Lomentospora prolificans]|uniref:Six-hairpin glycosidase n=1 Tax=Lomentospora prolificans TaxID=41688 RepID=A0A2N3MZ36_9PEZI|nr:hypothetical protein jhhlp_008808 [Lomentospora prolificans]